MKKDVSVLRAAHMVGQIPDCFVSLTQVRHHSTSEVIKTKNKELRVARWLRGQNTTANLKAQVGTCNLVTKREK